MTDWKTDIIESDLHYSSRFDRRVLDIFRVAVLVFPALLIGHGLAPGGDMATFLAHTATWFMAAVIVFTARDGASCLIFTNVFWTFVVSIYLYQTFSGQQVNTGFYNPERSATIAMCSQGGLLVAYFLSPRQPVISRAFLSRNFSRLQTMRALEPVLLVIGGIGILSSALNLLPPSIYSRLIFFFYVFIAVRAGRLRSGIARDPLFWISFGVLAVISVVNNSRTTLLAFILVCLFLMLIFRHRLITLPLILAAMIFVPMLSFYSDVSIAVRFARYNDIPIGPVFVDRFFNLEALADQLNPFDGEEERGFTVEEIEEMSDFYSPVFGRGNAGLFGRLTLMPHMDIVTARLPASPAFTDWDTFWRITGSVLPSIGQQKELIYSDKVVWDLGLRNRLSVMRPMITAQGELFSLGGYPFVTVVPAICFWIMNMMYRAIVTLCVSRVVGLLILPQLLIHSVLSSTFLSQLSMSTRSPLIFLFGMGLLILLASGYLKRDGPGRRAPHPAQ